MATTEIGNNGSNSAIPTTTSATNFAAEIFNIIATTNSEQNVIISPLLLEAMLAVLYLGTDGATAEELKRVLQLKRFGSNAKMANYYAGNLETATKAQTETQIQLNNKILVNERYEIAEEFQKIAHKYFHTATEKVSSLKSTDILRQNLSASMAKIGAHCMESLLKTAVTADADGGIVIMASNFKNTWFLPFSAYRSGIYDFHVNATLQKPVPMLYDDDMFVKFGEFRELDARAIELPYEHDDELSMLLVLPNKRDGLAELVQQLQTVDLSSLTEGGMQMESVQVLVPQFKIDFECSLRRCLEKLGVSSIFSKDANFKNLLSENYKESLQISDILHKVCIEVYESGSVASSVVAHKPIVISNSIDSRQKFFRADHPFYFAIRNGDVTYFVGHVTKF